MTGAVAYDTAGNLTSWNGNGYTYDQFKLMSRMVAGAEDWYYFYTADDERIWMHKPGGPFRSEWTLRGLDNKTLAIFSESGGIWSLFRQFVYRDGVLAAARTGPSWTAMHLDHLGSPRAITNSSGANTAYHAYYAFGEEVTGFAQDDETMKFTGHERDLASTAGSGDDLDYMHARHFNPLTSRFLSTDPMGGSPQSPQGWNRYTYVLNSPVTLVDPRGLTAANPGCTVDYITDNRGNTRVTLNCTPQNPWEIWGVGRELPPIPGGGGTPGPGGGGVGPTPTPTPIDRPRYRFREQRSGCDIIFDRPLGYDLTGCCARHDACYTRYRCSMASWFNGTDAFDPCDWCNLEALLCIDEVMRRGPGGPTEGPPASPTPRTVRPRG